MITIIDYGTCNVASIANMLKKTGAASLVTDDPDKIAEASKLILPGVGSFDTAMNALRAKGLLEVLEKK